MALLTLNDLMKVQNNEVGGVLRNLTTALNGAGGDWNKLGGTLYSTRAYSGIDPSLISWYNSQTSGKTQEQIQQEIQAKDAISAAKTEQMIASGQLNAQGLTPQEVAQNTVAEAEYQKRLGATQVPTNAGQVTSTFSSPIFPNVSPSTGNPTGAIAGTTGMNTMLDTLMKQNADNEQARIAREQTRATENKTLFDKLMSGTVSPGDARLRAQNETGINPANYFAEEKARIEKINVLTQEYNSVKAQKEAQIAATQDKLGSMNFINNQTAQIERNAAPKLNQISANINSEAAVLQALQGRFNEAQQYVNQAVQDAVADTKFKFDSFSMFYEMNQDSIERLDSIYKDSFTTAMNIAERQYDQQLKDKTAIGELMISNPQAGISINDTLDQAYAKIGQKPQTSSQIVGSADTGYKLVVTDNSGRLISSTPISSGKGSTGTLSLDGQAYLDGVLEDDDFSDKNYLRQVKLEANKLAQAALNVSTTTSPTNTSNTLNTVKNFATVKQDVGSGFPAIISNTANAVESFFTNLFGR
jgi:hypothetical protein